MTHKKGTPGHVAIFIIKDKAGHPYYLHRMTLGEKVTLNTKRQINEYFQDYVKRNKTLFKQLPDLESEPIYYYNKNR
jgi:hypothetical protein